MSFRARSLSFFFLPVLLVAVTVALVMVFKRQTSPTRPRENSNSNTQSDPSDADSSSAEYQLTDVTEELGIRFVHEPGFPAFFLPEVMCSGVALLDYDQDGRLDIYFRNATPGPPHPLGTADTPHAYSHLFHQEPDGRFIDVTERSGLAVPDFGMGVAVGDINNDGYPDIYAANFGPDRLFVNQRDGTFLDITQSAQIDNPLLGSSAAFVDYDRDGRLDLFVTNYVDYSNPKQCEMANGRRDYCHPKFFPPTPSKLYRNITDLAAAKDDPSAIRFEDVSESSGIARRLGPGLGVRPIDINDDGWPDIYVANDSAANFLWINQRDGTFRDFAVPMGAAYDSAGRTQASMGIAEGDVDGDGRFDLLITNYRGEGSILYRGRPHGFEDFTTTAGLLKPSFPYTGFGVALADFDHDGDLDQVVANGSVVQREDRPPLGLPSATDRDPAAVARFWKAYAEPNQFLLNTGTGRFKDVSARAGDFARVQEISRGLAVGDLDGDGDLDVVVTNTAGPARVYRNDMVKRGHWLIFRVIDPALGNRDAYGAIVTVTAREKTWIRRVQPASSYQSSDDPRVHFGLGQVEMIDHVEVKWPDGSVERFSVESLNSTSVLRHGEGQSQ